ncbi:MAG: transketolase C-terminal domain-containing protein [Tissierellia bacterium]|nr:transketolase C-terminal domain-containing protein [Tissierellia bacterium]
MGEIKALDGNAAIAYGVMKSKVQLVAAYPITPQTPIVETISSLIDKGEYDATYITVESEHSALSAVTGASSTGVRTFTASASHGLALMHEVTGNASASRLPIVMAVVSRAIPGPLSLWCDHSDIMTQRDQGWIQLFAKSPQEALDFTLIAYRLSESKNVMIPTMVDIDGFYCSHLTEPVEIPTDEEANSFIDDFKIENLTLNPDEPYAINNLTSPEIFTEIKKSQDDGMREASNVVDDIFEEFNSIFDRKYSRIMCDDIEDADCVVICMGSMSGTVKHTIKKLRNEGYKVGVVRIVMFRPFPHKELGEILKDVKNIAVIDRVSGMGTFGPLYEEVITSLNITRNIANKKLYNFVAGLGGRDIWENTIRDVVNKTESLSNNDEVVNKPIWIDLKD